MENYLFIWQSFILLSFLLLLIAVPHILGRNLNTNKKILWVVISLFIPFFGPLYYLVIGRKNPV